MSVCEKTKLGFFLKIQKIPFKPPHNFVSSGMRQKQGTARDQMSFSSFALVDKGYHNGRQIQEYAI
jgi:hypothetical protein